MNIVFPSSYIQANIVSILLTIAIPIIFLWYYKRRTHVKIGSFFVGLGFSCLFTYLLTYVCESVVISLFGLGDFLGADNHPVYSALFGAIVIGLVSTVGSYIGLRYAMKNRPGRSPALMFGLGMGSFECILNGGAVYIANLVAALFINSMGSAEYLASLGLTGDELTSAESSYATLAATAPSDIYINATLLLMVMIQHVAITLLIYYGQNEEKKGYMFPAALALHVLGYVPVYLGNISEWQGSIDIFSIAIVYTFALAYIAYITYHRQDGVA